MQYLWDLGILCVLVLVTALGVKRGFIKSTVHFLGAVIAAFLASALGGAAAKWVFDAFFREGLVARIASSIAPLGEGSISAAVSEVLESLPDFLVRTLEDAGITANSLEGIVSTRSGEVPELIADALAPVFISFLKVLAVFVLFMLFMILVRLLADLVSSMFTLPLLRQVNGLLGGVFGFLLALVSIWVILSALQVFLPMLTPEAQTEVNELLDRSVILGILTKMNPLRVMFGK